MNTIERIEARDARRSSALKGCKGPFVLVKADEWSAIKAVIEAAKTVSKVVRCKSVLEATSLHDLDAALSDLEN